MAFPADAVAVTANLTVVGQTKGGFVSITPTSDSAPTTSNINFPVGDTRANGLTAKLGAGGDIWLVYKGPAGSRTDLILDVTGYYLPAGDGLLFHALNPGRVMDTRTSLLSGLTGSFNHNVSRALDTDGHWGVPAGAKAVTGNLTVTGQTKGGFVVDHAGHGSGTHDIDDQLPARRHARQWGHRPAQRERQHEPHLQGGVRQDPPHPGRHGLLRVAAPTTGACAARRGSRSARSPRRRGRQAAPP